MRFNELNEQRRKAKSYYHASKAMGEMLMLLNPIIGLAVILLAKVTAEIRQSNIQAQRNHLLRQIEQIRGEITKLEAQKAQLKIENQELLHAYLDAKTAYKEYKEGLKVVDQEIHGAGIEEYAKTAEIVSGVIHITPSNYRSIILPQGFSIHSHGNTPILCTPYSNHVIPVGGLYLANETVMTENTYRSYQQRHKTARSTNKPTKEGVKL